MMDERLDFECSLGGPFSSLSYVSGLLVPANLEFIVRSIASVHTHMLLFIGKLSIIVSYCSVLASSKIVKNTEVFLLIVGWPWIQ